MIRGFARGAPAIPIALCGACTAACGGRVGVRWDAGFTDASTSDQSIGGATSPDVAEPEGGGVSAGIAGQASELYTPPQVQAAKDLCSAPHGPVDSFHTAGDLRSHLVGAWWLCSQLHATPTAGPIAFTTDGQWFLLQSDAAGGLVQGQGMDSQGTYHIEGQGQSGWVDNPPDSTVLQTYLVYIITPTGRFSPDSVAFETSPKRMKVIQGTSAYTGWYVALGGP